MNELLEQLEAIIDSAGIENVLQAIQQVCFEKAEHILTNWQDKNTAEYWENIANQIDKIKL